MSSSDFSSKTICFSRPYVLHAPSISFFSIIRMCGEEYRQWNSSLCSLFHPQLSGPFRPKCILLNTLFANTLSLCFVLSVRVNASHPRNTTDKILVLCVFGVMFFDIKLEGWSLWTKLWQAFPEFNLLLVFPSVRVKCPAGYNLFHFTAQNLWDDLFKSRYPLSCTSLLQAKVLYSNKRH